MTKPSPRPPAASAMYGAIDLSGLKAQPKSEPAQAAPAQAPADASAVFDVTEADFEQQVLERSTRQVVVVDLWATWCQPCRQLSPVLESLAAAANGRWVLAKVDVDQNPQIAQAFGARSIPMVVALAGGRPVSAFQGAQPEPVVRQWLADVFEQAGPLLGDEAAGPPESDPVDPRLVAASQALADGDFAQARSLFDDVKERAQDEMEGSQKAAARQATAEAGLREVTFLERASLISPDAVGRAQEHPEDVAAQLEVADLEVAAGRTELAFDRLISVVRISADPDRTTARKRLLDLFELFDPADPVVVGARRRLASALY